MSCVNVWQYLLHSFSNKRYNTGLIYSRKTEGLFIVIYEVKKKKRNSVFCGNETKTWAQNRTM